MFGIPTRGSLVLLLTKGLNYGIDFAGGVLMEVQQEQPVDLAQLRGQLDALNVGEITLQTFGLCFALAFLAAGALVWKRFVELGKPAEWGYEMGFAALVGGLVGSRVYYLVQNYSEVKGDLQSFPLLKVEHVKRISESCPAGS